MVLEDKPQFGGGGLVRTVSAWKTGNSHGNSLLPVCELSLWPRVSKESIQYKQHLFRFTTIYR